MGSENFNKITGQNGPIVNGNKFTFDETLKQFLQGGDYFDSITSESATAQYTWVFHVNPVPGDVGGRIISKNFANTGGRSYAFFTNGTDNFRYILLNEASTSNTVADVTVTSSAPSSKVTIVIATDMTQAPGSRVTIWINGVEDSQTDNFTNTGVVDDVSQPLIIGGHKHHTGAYLQSHAYNGNIYEILLYNRLLTQADSVEYSNYMNTKFA